MFSSVPAEANAQTRQLRSVLSPQGSPSASVPISAGRLRLRRTALGRMRRFAPERLGCRPRRKAEP
jgi:hypothetical protein